MADKITRESIIRALLDTSFRRSAGATSLSDIADNLSIKKASLYNHFSSREDIINSTMSSCGDYVREITFIPENIDAVSAKYPAETVLKGIANRYIKMHEKSPLFQIYTFVQSQKYYSFEAAEIVKAENEKLIAQTEQVLGSLVQQGKLSLTQEKIHPAAVWFCSGIANFLNLYLLDRKQVAMENPAEGAGELFSLPADESGLSRINSFVEEFVALIR